MLLSFPPDTLVKVYMASTRAESIYWRGLILSYFVEVSVEITTATVWGTVWCRILSRHVSVPSVTYELCRLSSSVLCIPATTWNWFLYCFASNFSFSLRYIFTFLSQRSLGISPAITSQGLPSFMLFWRLSATRRVNQKSTMRKLNTKAWCIQRSTTKVSGNIEVWIKPAAWSKRFRRECV